MKSRAQRLSLMRAYYRRNRIEILARDRAEYAARTAGRTRLTTKGRKHPSNCGHCRWLAKPESRMKITSGHIGRVPSEQERRNISIAKTGVPRIGRILRGADHPNWRGGKSPEQVYWFNSEGGRSWMRGVRARDHYRCVLCWATKHLHAHHIKFWRDHPSLRSELSNGITLCAGCHRRVHLERICLLPEAA